MKLQGDRHVIVIAEAGVNHNGSKEKALQLIDVAIAAGANAVKFQTFKTDNIVTKGAEKAIYQKQTTTSEESQFDMLKRLELSYDIFHELFDYCNKKGIEFLSTAFDMESLDFLVNDLRLKTLKIPSGEITNGPLLLAHAKTGCDLIISTGMATLAEVEEALGVVAFGLLGSNEPSRAAFLTAFSSSEGRKVIKEKVTLLHCTTEYPAPIEDINLIAMKSMAEKFGLRIGYSDHSKGITVPIAAAALGATLIEKHFTLDKNLTGPDHKASLEPDELKNMVDGIRAIEKALGDGLKAPRPSELGNRNVARKSIVAAHDIAIGEKFSEENLAIKRPGTGQSPMEYWDLLGKESQCKFRANEIIS